MNEYLRRSIESLREFQPLLQRLVNAAEPADTRLRPAAGAWSLVEVIGHLTDAERVMRERLAQICASDHPQIVPFDQDASVVRNNYQAADCGRLLHALADERALTLRFIDAQPVAAFSRTGWHQEVGLMRVDMMIEYLAKHDYEHYRHIHQILRHIARVHAASTAIPEPAK